MLQPRVHAVRRCVLVALASIFLCSCLERKEKIRVDPDGRTAFTIEYKTDDQNELTRGDAMPRLQGGWIADVQTERDDDGKEHYALKAEASFKPGGRLPANYALPADADSDLYTQFPTTVKVEKTPQGTYYHFTRTYQARPWATIELLRKQYFEQPIQEFKDVNPDQWTAEQRALVIQSMANFETARMLLYAREAFRIVTPEATPDRWLGVRKDMNDCAAQIDAAKLDQMMRHAKIDLGDDEEQTRIINEETRKFQLMLEERLQTAVKNLAGYDGAQAAAFMGEFARQRKKYEVTEGLEDDSFEITLEMPGEIVASNADSVSGGAATWSFRGDIVRDHELELMATSFVPR